MSAAHILSLGGGVQSSTLALMAALGEVTPMPTASVFADTQEEPGEVYAWLDWLEGHLPFPVHRVTRGRLSEAALRPTVHRKTGAKYIRGIIPAFVRNEDGSRGILGRSCTNDYKLVPLYRKIREIVKPKRKGGAEAIIWIGISLDEVHRMKPSLKKWAQNRWPLIEANMTRHDCLRWMKAKGFPTPPRSACTFCPFHSDHEWRRLKAENPLTFSAAVAFERELQGASARDERKNKLRGVPYLHDSLAPLDQVDFSEDERQGQLKFGNECEGLCGV